MRPFYPKKILMIFFDGVGIGKDDPECNPFFAYRMKSFEYLFEGKIPHLKDSYFSNGPTSLIPLDATLGIDGLPQSGTGQVALITGVNAPQLIGKHFGPYPNSLLKPILREENLFKKLNKKGKKLFFANAYPRQFFEHLKLNNSRITATTYSWLKSGFDLNDGNKLARGEALSSDITNERWSELGYPEIKIISPYDAGKKLINFTQLYDFVFFEYYFTDHVGHHQSFSEAKLVLTKIDDMLLGVFENLNNDTTLLLITSDHGNFEDLSSKSHTRNPVPLIAHGIGNREMTQNIFQITDMTPRILDLLN